MPTWSTLLNESQKNTTNQNPNGGIDYLFSKKREFIKRLSEKTGRKCIDAGLDVIRLEEDRELQDLVLSIHHCCMILAEQSIIIKIVENNIGGCYLRNLNQHR